MPIMDSKDGSSGKHVFFANKNLNSSSSAASLTASGNGNNSGSRNNKREESWNNFFRRALRRKRRTGGVISPSYDDGEQRRYVRGADPKFNSHCNYCDNSIKTSRYTWWNFLPLNLFEQLLRVANCYFLFLIILQSIPLLSPLSPVAQALAVFLIFALTAGKYGMDDFYRHQSDKRINYQTATILAAGGNAETEASTAVLKAVRWKDIKVGQVVALKNNESVPADLLLLSTSSVAGTCFIETADLDGETNLKFRQCLEDTQQQLGNDLQNLYHFRGEIECQPPNNHLSKFDGRLDWQGKTYSLNNDNVLLRGCTIRNTPWAFGLVIYAGQQTKLMKNSGKTFLKRTQIDRLSNKFIFSVFFLMLVLLIIAASLGARFESDTGYYFKESYSLWMPVKNINPALIGVIQFFSYVILIQTLVPIAIYITFEFIQSVLSRTYINGDLQMYHQPSDTPASARTTSLNEDLGQIEYVFSDKTGTLTQNVMTFNMCSIAGKKYGNKNSESILVDFSKHEPVYWEPSFQFWDEQLLDDLNNNNSDDSQKIADFFLLLTLCHTLTGEVDEKGNLVYQAQSPDEIALVMAARNFGFVYKSRTQSSITIQVMGSERSYGVLCVLEFDTTRKRMSVVIEDGDRKKRLLCKGADSHILPLLNSSNDPEILIKTNEHILDFANDGFRVLCCAARTISDSEWDVWFEKYKTASTNVESRDELLGDCCMEIERDLDLVGVTAVEDKLQEGVPDTIAKLKNAGINVWVLTGDKQETAVNIGHSCNLLHKNMEEYVVDGEDAETVEHQLRRILERIAEEKVMRGGGDGGGNNGTTTIIPMVSLVTTSKIGVALRVGSPSGTIIGENNALIINGHSLYHALSEKLEDLFLSTASSCQAVLCCRVAPLQKGRIVDLVKRKKNVLTLAIGDGANDVNMIKTAHIGVGISGQEGRQAVLSSDFALAQFRFLQQLLLVHGRLSYRRVSLFMLYFFYKTFTFTLSQFWYGFYCGWSAAPLYDTWYIFAYNFIYTATPVIYAALCEQDVEKHLALKFPKLYYPGPANLLFSIWSFLSIELEGVWSSAVIFFLTRYGFGDYNFPDGNVITTSRAAMGVAVGTCLVFVVMIRTNLEVSYWTWANMSPVFSLLTTFGLQYMLAALLAGAKTEFEFYGIAIAVWTSPNFWLVTLAAVALSCLPILLVRFVRFTFQPSLLNRVQIRHQLLKKCSNL